MLFYHFYQSEQCTMTLVEELEKALLAPGMTTFLPLVNQILDRENKEDIDLLKNFDIYLNLNRSHQISAPLIIFVIVKNDIATLSKMIKHGFDCNAPIKEWNGQKSWVTPLMFACMYKNPVVVKLLLEQDVSLAGYTIQKLSLFETMAINSPRSIFEMLLGFATSKGKIKELLSISTEFQDKLKQEYNPNNILGSILAIIFTPSFNTCLTIKDLRVFAPFAEEYLIQKYPLINIKQTTISYPLPFFSNKTNKETYIKNALVIYRDLLDNIPKCFQLLQKLERAVANEIQRNYPQNTLQNIHSNDYNLVEHHGMQWPLPKESYKPVKLNSLLSRVIMHEMQGFGFAKSSYKWYGFLQTEIANQHVANGDYFTENTLDLNSLLHGKYSHPIQLLILMYAVEEGLIPLEYEEGLKLEISDLLLALVTKNEYQDMPWTKINDRLYTERPSFSGPQFLHSTLLVYGEQEGLLLLGSALKNSFFKAVTRSMNFYNTYFKGEFSNIQDFWSNLISLNSMTDFRSQEISGHFSKRHHNSVRVEKVVISGTIDTYNNESYIVTEKSFIKASI